MSCLYGALTDCLNGHLDLPIEKRVYCVLSNGLDLARLRIIFFELFAILKHFLRIRQVGCWECIFVFNRARSRGIASSWDGGATSKKAVRFFTEVPERGVSPRWREQRREHLSLFAAVESIAPMSGRTPQTLHDRVKRDQVDQADHGERDGVTADERERLEALERKVNESRYANEILKLARADSTRRRNTFDRGGVCLATIR